ncbi:MAG: DEAD/DEAH box helicase family protein [bacterium]|nr:DEAD/DEAH box helicase family protein [bacterium]
MPKPEEKARAKIDTLLTAAGWAIQSYAKFKASPSPKLGIAVCEHPVAAGDADYLLFIGGKAAGVIEAKKAGETLSGVAGQSMKYLNSFPDDLPAWYNPLQLHYESNGEEIYFRDRRDPKAKSRKVFAFHQPETLKAQLEEDKTLRGHFHSLPALVTEPLRECQIKAINKIEASMAKGKQKALVHMATGSGKTFMACNLSWRLIKHAGIKRVLFLVDRRNLGKQALKEFEAFQPPASAHKFGESYILKRMTSNGFDKDANLVISTIQRLYSMLQGEELTEEDEEASGFEQDERGEGEPVPVSYNPKLPIEAFDLIIVDECHRSIYGRWRQVLDYFDAHLVGLTATPSPHTLAFFQRNRVYTYDYAQSVLDKVNVDYEIYRIRTKITEQGSEIEGEPGFHVPVRHLRTRRKRFRRLDRKLSYSGKQLDRAVVAPDQIRLVLQTFKDKLFTEMFPGRSGEWVPKTIIFAKDDNHAEDITLAVREVFEESNEFCQKITYKIGQTDPETLINSFRLDPEFRIAVTVDMIATGTDIKPVEALLFMRDVRSEIYYEQMRGRGVRTLPDTDLQAVTPDASTKTRFVLVDVVGVSETNKSIPQPMERKRSVSLEQLLKLVGQGKGDEEDFVSLAARLTRLAEEKGEDAENQVFKKCGRRLTDLAQGLFFAVDPDSIAEATKKKYGVLYTDAQLAEVAADLRSRAAKPFEDEELITLILEIRSEIVLDEFSEDSLLESGFSQKDAKDRVDKLSKFLEENKDQLEALHFLYELPQAKAKLTHEALRELADTLTSPPWTLNVEGLWRAYKRLEQAKVKGEPIVGLLTEIIALVRFAIGKAEDLESYSIQAQQRYNLWIGRQKKAGREFDDEQMAWLEKIKRHLIANGEIVPDDFQEVPAFSGEGGIVKAREVFGKDLVETMDDLSKALIA